MNTFQVFPQIRVLADKEIVFMTGKNLSSAFFLLCLILIGITPQLLAQRSGYVHVATGTAVYTGDLSDSWTNNHISPALSLQGGVYVHPVVSFRGSLTYGSIGASDVDAAGEERRNRNLSFQSPVVELQAGIVYELWEDKDFRLRWKKKAHFSPFLAAGVAGFYMNPSAAHQGTTVPLQPLGTEGQWLDGHPTGPYNRVQLSLPVGAGLSVRLPNRVSVWAEAGFRKTFTDYIDDVSTSYANPDALAEVGGPLAATLADPSLEANPAGSMRGNDGAKDGYGFLTIGVGYFFGR